MQCREALGREASPTACVIDSQSVKSAEGGDRRNYCDEVTDNFRVIDPKEFRIIV